MKQIPFGNLAWKPLIFDLSAAVDYAKLTDLLNSNQVWQSHDTIESQLVDLAKTRVPRWKKKDGPKRIEDEIQSILKGQTTHEYGRWIYYPWSGQLVHLLPPDEYRTLRLDRNLYKNTNIEQEHLSEFSVGIVGLSVGNAIALAFALEGIGGHLKLADFDSLELSNMNRIRAGVEDIGLPKTVLAARQIYEFNPYANISLFYEGITEKNISEFLLGEPNLDILIDECDDLRIKFVLREHARMAGLPVIMETSDRGMLDVERFDLEPERPFFHGLVGDINGQDIPEYLSNEEKIKYALPILGLQTMSTRMAASMIEIEETISTWPQLASDVLLGGVTVSAAVRQIALGLPMPSGRRYIDIQAMLNLETTVTCSEAPSTRKLDFGDSIHSRSNDFPEFIRFVIAHAILAPSGGNSQPWQFYFYKKQLWLVHNKARSHNLFDENHRGALIALGATIYNIKVAAAHRGLRTQITPFPVTSRAEIVAVITFVSAPDMAQSELAALFPQLHQRVTSRKISGHLPLMPSHQSILETIANRYECSLQIITDVTDLAEIGDILGEGDRLRFLCSDLHHELMAELRWTAEEAVTTRDGIDIRTLELTEDKLAGIRVLARADVVAFLRQINQGEAIKELSQDAIHAASAVGLITIHAQSSEDILRGGQAIEHLWLKATELGLAWHPMTALIYMFEMLGSNAEKIFNSTELLNLTILQERFNQIFPVQPNQTRLMLFRLAQGAPPTTRALRLGLEDVLFRGNPL